MSALFHLYLCGRIAAEWLITMKKICIDAGHCKLTPGKQSFDGSLKEYEFNFDVASRIKRHLERHDLEAFVQQIVSKSPAAELNSRIKAVNADKDIALLVSVHANAFSQEFANGWEIFCNNPNNKNADGTRLAQLIHSESIPFLGIRDRGIKDAHGVAGIVTKTNPPAVLIEHGFYTNEKELALLKSNEYREKCAVADAKGILKYLGIAWKEEKEPEQEDKEPMGTKRYKTVAELPESLRKEVQALVDHGSLKGNGNGDLYVTEDMIRAIIIATREAEYRMNNQ